MSARPLATVQDLMHASAAQSGCLGDGANGHAVDMSDANLLIADTRGQSSIGRGVSYGAIVGTSRSRQVKPFRFVLGDVEFTPTNRTLNQYPARIRWVWPW